MDINFEYLKRKFGKKAKDYANNKKKTQKLVDEAIKKARKKGPLEEIWDDVQLVFSIVKDWATGRYTEIPTGSIVAIIIGLLYFVSPIDLIPDCLPGGLIDDAAVLALVFKQVRSDLEKYAEWRESIQETL